jgi:hypothetical protein
MFVCILMYKILNFSIFNKIMHLLVSQHLVPAVKPPVPVEQEGQWAPKLVSALCKTQQLLSPASNRTINTWLPA